ncbi:long-chain fatty acid--CoA ligase [Nocardioides sp. zg-536]|uniref:Long-chain fatty acid--CoA ligase n=1 Tax=Nocardioides faecalis TaxID=2803858 RepID=A0A938Y210_9ACTN|nr:long-chain fatty acid--CoA ligase [Nocardioides faecalis]MBM9458478.1 long-chain fatty acid--CoA ligase [Nocardioides faecalis]QVI58491.1 long-chain fatty acid--CoA ligase [Nocardioides faecalis]
MTNLAGFLENSAREFPERTAIVLGETRLSYPQVDAAANQVANLLVSRGIGPGDKVALSCPNLPYFSIVYNGILKAGATVVPLNVLLKGREVAYHLGDSDAKALFAFEGTPDLPIGKEAFEGFGTAEGCEHFFLITADPAAPSPIEGAQTFGAAVAGQPATFDTVDVADDDTAVILYTSGTTGQPKGAELTHRNMRSNALASESLFGADAAHPDTYLCVLPLFHSFGQTVIQNGAFAYGGTVVMLPRFEPKAAISLMLSEKVTFFAGVPTMYWGLLGALDDSVDVATLANNLRVAVAGGAALPVEVHHRFEERFGVTILEGYGLSETSPVASFSPYGEPVRVGSIGTPIRGVEMKLIDPDGWDDVREDGAERIGEIAIRGDNVMKGYYKRPEATAQAISPDGWFRSGDLGRKDADGWYYIVDRSKDMIIRGGYNVYPREIEEVLLTHPAISLAAVIGVPHETHGEEIKAVVILEPGASATPEEIVAWGKEQMAAYKYPRIVEIVDALPMTATGKILKRELS